MRERAFGRILLAIDRSPQSDNAVGVLSGFAAHGSRAHVLHVWKQPIAGGRGRWDVETRHEAQELVDRNVARLKAAGLDASGELRSSQAAPVAGVICATASDFGADLIAIGSRGRSDLGGLFLGSVSHEVVAGTDRPVLVVRAVPDPRRTERRILLALAGEEDAQPAIDTAISIAHRRRAEVLVFHASTAVAAGVEPPEAAMVVDRAVAELTAAGVQAAGRVVRCTGPVASVIADATVDWNAELVVMGSHRIGELRGLLTGATDHALVHGIETPVLIAARTSGT